MMILLPWQCWESMPIALLLSISDFTWKLSEHMAYFSANLSALWEWGMGPIYPCVSLGVLHSAWTQASDPTVFTCSKEWREA